MSQPEFNFDAPPKKTAAEVSAAVVERIKKLLRLSESSNPHEAELAMQKAMEEADRHNLDIASLGTDPEVEHIVHKWVKTTLRLSREQRLAIGIVQKFFNVTPCIYKGEGGVMFIGTASDIAIAEYVAAFLVGACRRCLAAWEKAEKAARRRTTSGKWANYTTGFFYGISRQLDTRRAQLCLEHERFALILADQAAARKNVMDDVCGETRQVERKDPRRNWSALESGFQDGRRTQINAGLGQAGGKLLLQ